MYYIIEIAGTSDNGTGYYLTTAEVGSFFEI